jgi:hypothetical protein
MSELDDVKRDVALANRVLSNLGLATGITAALGHASMRLPSDPAAVGPEPLRGEGARV